MNKYIETVRKEMDKTDRHRCDTKDKFVRHIIYKPDEKLEWDSLILTNKTSRFFIVNTKNKEIEYMKSKVQKDEDFYHTSRFPDIAKLSVYSTIKIGKEKIFGVNSDFSEESFFYRQNT